MDKTELLFMMMEHPEQYTDQQWQEILMDDECRELYAMMSKVKSTFDVDRHDQRGLDDAFVKKEWETFQAHHQALAKVMPLWRKVAAAIVVAIAFCGITIAAVHHFNAAKQDTPTTTVDNQQMIQNDNGHQTATAVNGDVAEAAQEPRLYDNVPLDEIISDMATRYGVQVEWQTEEARCLRLHYQWEPSYSLDKVVEMLNSFESFNITRDGDKLVISDRASDK